MSDYSSLDFCQEKILHPESLGKVTKDMPRKETVEGLADLFKVLSDRTRVQILLALASAELCVCDLTEVLNISTSAVSHQLRVLRAARLVRFRREGKKIFYRLVSDNVQELFEKALGHVLK